MLTTLTTLARAGRTALALALLLGLVVAAPLFAQQPAPADGDSAVRPWGRADNVVVPQRASWNARNHGARSSSAPVERIAELEITGVRVGVVIREMAATTTMEISLRNPTGVMQQAVVINPVPTGAVVRGFDFEGEGAEPSAELLPAGEARSTFDGIVRKMQDPALLEFVGYAMIRSSVFPVPANGTQKVRLTYEHLLSPDGNRVDYVLPRSEALDYRVPWTINVRIMSRRTLSAVYSPSHPLTTQRGGEEQVRVTVPAEAAQEPGPFRLSYLFGDDAMNATVFTTPDASGSGGYFLLVAGLTADADKTERPALKREVTFVVDRSGSMGGEKIEQARAAMRQVLESLAEGEAFNIVDFSNAVGKFASEPVIKSAETIAAARSYIANIRPGGGTNIHAALTEALRQKPTEGMLPIVLFLTDGLPTTGETGEVAIRNVAIKQNPHNRRIFTIGVGNDVNTPLLDRIGETTRATSTYVQPGENVEVKVSSVFGKLAGPVMADLSLKTVNADGSEQPGRVADLQPGRLNDLFDGDQLVLLGRYIGEAPVSLQVGGNYLGTQRSFRFSFNPDKATTRNAFVSRLWASRKIATLVDDVRQLGAADSSNAMPSRNANTHEAKVKELVDEIVKLSTQFGILTEYTAFLALEGSNLGSNDEVMEQAERNLRERAMNTRSGVGGVNQAMNYGAQRQQSWGNARNGFWDENMKRVEVTGVQQVNDRAFFRRNGNWVDSAIVAKQNDGNIKPDRVVKFGSEEYTELLSTLTEQNRQGCIAMGGAVLLMIDGKSVLVTAPEQECTDDNPVDPADDHAHDHGDEAGK
ncbi:MAG: VWA domain-containing protein [Planctomycetota bacterium]